MHFAVLMKQTFDTEEKIKLNHERIEEDSVKFIMNPYDEYAVEEALRLREQHGGKVTVLSVGPERAAEALRTALAMGADEAVRIEPPAGECDETVLAQLLSAALQRELPDLLLGGYFSVDQGAGQVAIRVAARLGWPHVSAVTKVQVNPSNPPLATVQRDVEGATETVEVSLPALFTAQQGLNDPRYPTLPGIMKAKKKPFQVYTADILGLTTGSLQAATTIQAVTLPPVRKAGTVLKGELDEQIQQLAVLLEQAVK